MKKILLGMLLGILLTATLATPVIAKPQPSTHGPDNLDHFQVQAKAASLPLPTSSSHFECAGTGTPRIKLLHRWPKDRVNTVYAEEVRYEFYLMAESMSYSASPSNTLKLRVECNAQGLPSVDYGIWGFTATQGKSNIFNIRISDLQSQGYKDVDTKYVVLDDQPDHPAPGGQGSWFNDDRQSPYNLNNGEFGGGAMYALNYGVYGFNGGEVLRHETLHAMGAVNTSAPNTDGTAHCRQGSDIMCQGSQSIMACVMSPYPYNTYPTDCKGDDYFLATHTSTGYLSNHWNIGFCWDRFISLRPYCNWDYSTYPTFYQR